MSPEKRTEVLKTYETMMFTRDPFSRLFSGYVDKILAPNQIGAGTARKIRQAKLWPQEEPFCDLRVTFQSFALHIADSILKRRGLNYHFGPIHQQCNPCKFNFTLIGTMENFLGHTREIFNTVGIPWSDVFGNGTNVKETSDVTIIKDMVHREFGFLGSLLSPCITRREGLERLWAVFQVRGFISKHIPFPLNFKNKTDASVNKAKFVDLAVQAYHNSGDRETVLKQRKEAMLEAYSLLPRTTLKDLGKAFHIDCQLFNYSCDVEKRFPERKDRELFYFADMVRPSKKREETPVNEKKKNQ